MRSREGERKEIVARDERREGDKVKKKKNGSKGKQRHVDEPYIVYITKQDTHQPWSPFVKQKQDQPH